MLYKFKVRFYFPDIPEASTVVVDVITWAPLERAYKAILDWRSAYGVHVDAWLEPMPE